MKKGRSKDDKQPGRDLATGLRTGMREVVMNILVAGATGAIGVPLTRQLLAAGHGVIGITKTPANHEKLRALGAEPLVADAMDRDALLRAVDGMEADAVIHQLTALKDASPRLRPDDPTNALRTQGTANLIAAARVVGARRLVTQSLIFGYGYGAHGTRAITEDDPFGRPQGIYTDPLIAGLHSAERQTFEAEGIEGIALRYGLFYGPTRSATSSWSSCAGGGSRSHAGAAARSPGSTSRTPPRLPWRRWSAVGPGRRTT